MWSLDEVGVSLAPGAAVRAEVVREGGSYFRCEGLDGQLEGGYSVCQHL